MSTDERRARDLCSYEAMDTTREYVDANWPRFLPQARAIRTSDEAAGLALVPRRAIALIEGMISSPVSSYSVAALDGLFNMIRDQIAAATESDNG